jgi:hypothetical protein
MHQTENVPPPSRRNSIEMPQSASAMDNLSHALIAQDYERQLESVIPDIEVKYPAPNKIKRTRLLLDARTELTDDELKVMSSVPLRCLSACVDVDAIGCSCAIFKRAKSPETRNRSEEVLQGRYQNHR